MSAAEDGFRRLTIGDPGILAAMDGSVASELDVRRLDARTDSLVRIGVLIALDAPESSYRQVVDEGRAASVRLEDMLAVLVSVGGVVGSARLISAAPKIAFAAGYDVDAALEAPTPSAPPR